MMERNDHALPRRAWSLERLGPVRLCAAVAFATAVLITPGDPASLDTECRLQVTHWIWRGAPQVVADGPHWCNAVPGRNGVTYAAFGIGQSVAMLPADLAAHAMLRTVSASDSSEMVEKAHLLLVTLGTFPLLAAATAAFAVLLLQCLGASAREAGLAFLVVLFGTSLLPYIHVGQENLLTFLLVCGGLYHGVSGARARSGPRLLAAGALLGATLLVKVTNIALAGPLVAGLIVLLRTDGSRLRQSGALIAAMAAGFCVMVLAERGYHWFRFGIASTTYAPLMQAAWTRFGGQPADYPFGFPRLSGALGPLVSARKSVFVFDPLLVPLAAFVCAQWPRQPHALRVLMIASALAFVALVAAFSGTYFWNGDSAWGPRHHLVPIHLFLLLSAAAALRALPSMGRGARRLAGVVLAAGIGVQAIELPRSFNLEVAQANVGIGPSVVPVARIANLWALGSGSFLDGNRYAGNEHIPPIALDRTAVPLLFIRVGPYLSPGWANVVAWTWGASLIAFLVCVASIARRWSRLA
jgi:hypothetical protein